MSRMYRSPATTSLVTKLREQLAAQQDQTESLRGQLDEVMRGTRATRVGELQAEAKAQERELGRQAEMLRVMKKRMEEAEARAAEALDRCNAAERLAKMQGPLVALQQAIAASEARYGRSENGSSSGAAASANAIAAASGSSTTAGAVPSATATGVDGGSAAAADASNVATSGGSPTAALQPGAGSGGGGSGGSPAAGSEGAAAAAAAAAASPPSPSGASRQHQQSSSSASSAALSGGQTLSSSRIKKTMMALGDAHRALLSQATLLTEVFPPGLTTEQLCIRAALRPATFGAPEVLRYLRHHVHKMVDVLSALPGNRLEMKQEEEDVAVSGSGANRNNGNNRNINNCRNANGQRGTPRSSMTGQTLRAAASAKVRGGGGGGSGGGAPAEEFDPWGLLGDLLDFVRWLRSLDIKSLESRPDLAGGLEQLSSVVGICDQETRRLLGAVERTVAGNGA
ncbi:hypothetical protein Vafri_13170 [Volvox africanus]|nr:hypothetical protein Vafri_13170 [Volvox africanus]